MNATTVTTDGATFQYGYSEGQTVTLSRDDLTAALAAMDAAKITASERTTAYVDLRESIRANRWVGATIALRRASKTYGNPEGMSHQQAREIIEAVMVR